ncbi:spermidine/putrescine ABC transporter substrate-binding protein [Asticcacaulis sp. 201]|uniref:ABC transporter substrate-binding protein n=1 Tax=Asticcacaulis sp. 201 TaxID=3028787 RepID=UPI002915F306|nr:spermidine/putrescine ABC transporter substrate-binding protein [Asticcacaulis sp. 201]MDV6330177.1 spermidine/putrescine ABC transporter substrate-binding protein [Asticcacaulis sp. 201]
MSLGSSRRSLLTAMGAAAVGISFGGLSGCTKPVSKSINFYNWDTYIGDTTLADFEKVSGVKVKMSIFATNDELFAKIKTGNAGFDVIVPSNDFVTYMSEAGLLLPLDHAKLPNLKNIDPAFMNPPYDPGRKFSVPYTWLVLGIGYRKSAMKDGKVPDSWKWLFDSDQYKGRMALLQEAGDLMRLGAKYLGHSVNGIPDDVLKQVEAMLIKQKPYIKAFHSDDGQDMLLSKEVDIVMEYNGDIAQVMKEDPDLDFIVPKEGSQINSDTLAIPKDAPNPEEAHAFINYMMDAEAGAKIYEKILYPTPNAAAKALMPESYKNNPVIFPSAEVMAKCEYAAFEGPARAQVYDAALTRIKSA